MCVCVCVYLSVRLTLGLDSFLAVERTFVHLTLDHARLLSAHSECGRQGHEYHVTIACCSVTGVHTSHKREKAT